VSDVERKGRRASDDPAGTDSGPGRAAWAARDSLCAAPADRGSNQGRRPIGQGHGGKL